MAFTLNQPVGNLGGVKTGPDVLKVQRALNNVPPNEGGPLQPLETDSMCGPITLKAIQTFQLKHFGWKGADGRVDVMGPTHQKLNDYYSDGMTSPSTGQPAVPGAPSTGPGVEPVDPSPDKSQSFSIRINNKVGLKSTADTWRVLITDEANQRSKPFKVRKLLDLYPDSALAGWSPAYYFKLSKPAALDDFQAAGIRFGSVLTIDPTKTVFEGRETWWNRLALHLASEGTVRIYNDTPFRLYECWRDSMESPNRDNAYEHRMTGTLDAIAQPGNVPSWPIFALDRGRRPSHQELYDEAMARLAKHG
jgi:hypothetical protein